MKKLYLVDAYFKNSITGVTSWHTIEEGVTKKDAKAFMIRAVKHGMFENTKKYRMIPYYEIEGISLEELKTLAREKLHINRTAVKLKLDAYGVKNVQHLHPRAYMPFKAFLDTIKAPAKKTSAACRKHILVVGDKYSTTPFLNAMRNIRVLRNDVTFSFNANEERVKQVATSENIGRFVVSITPEVLEIIKNGYRRVLSDSFEIVTL